MTERAAPPSITCPVCGLTSYNPNDVRERYCVRCHQFHEWMPQYVIVGAGRISERCPSALAAVTGSGFKG
jgi:hypothetical protein